MDDKCPTEIWLKIFALACVGTGKTGCSLSAVSHRIRDMSAEYRYQSVAASSMDRIHVLRRRLATLPEPLRRIRHMYLDCSGTTFLGSGLGQGLRVNESTSAALIADIHAILALVAPTLCTLSLAIFLPTRLTDAVFARQHFPRLTELTARGTTAIPYEDPNFAPKLERLHTCAILIPPTGPRNLAHCVASTFPRLTHLRLSDMARYDLHQMLLISNLLRAFGMDIPFSNAPRMPSGVRYLYVQLGPADAASTARQVGPGADVLRAYHGSYRAFVPLPRSSRRNIFQVADTTKAEWLDRMDGGAGCWAVPKRG